MRRRTLLAALALLPLAAAAGWRRETEEPCARIDRQLKEIEAERRVGYTAKRGRKLELQRDKLVQKRRELGR